MPYTLGCSGMHWEPLGDRVRLTSFVAVGVYANHTPIMATTHMNNDPGMIPSNYVEVFSYNDTDWNHIGLPMDEGIGSGLALALTSAESVRVGFFVSGSSSPNAAGSVFGNVDAGGWAPIGRRSIDASGSVGHASLALDAYDAPYVAYMVQSGGIAVWNYGIPEPAPGCPGAIACGFSAPPSPPGAGKCFGALNTSRRWTSRS